MWLTQIGRLGQLTISLHLITALLFLLILSSAYSAGLSLGVTLLLIPGIVLSYAAHEYAHFMMISIFSREHRDLFNHPLHIILYPFGLAVELDNAPNQQALRFSALAGPVASLLLAGCCLTASPLLEESAPALIPALATLYQVNVVLGLINMLPFFPFDFSIFTQRESTYTSRHLVMSIFINIGLLLVALSLSFYYLALIFIASSFFSIQMYVSSKTYAAAASYCAADAMIDKEHMTTLSHGLSLQSASPLVIKSFQLLFPVLQGSTLLGVLARESFLKASQLESEAPVGSCMERNLPAINSDTPLVEVLQTFERTTSNVLAVIDDEQFLGLLVKDRVIEFLFYTLNDFPSETAGLRDNE